jgi:signal-transduction protein with cAMP-binding, CBS, and nucleotidyltransferase domain
MKVDRIYTRNGIGVARSDTIQQAAQAMRRFHVGALLVVEDGKSPEVVGIVTDRDLVVLALAEGLAAATPVDKVMSPVVASVPEEADALEALERMRAAGVRRLMVTAGPQGKPAGIVSLDDLLDGLAAELASAAALTKASVGRESVEMGGRAAA